MGFEAFTFEEMQELLREKGVAKQYWPERLELLPDFPKTLSGKIRKFELRDQVSRHTHDEAENLA
ncbi:MAG TPA: hypothetical protein VF165_21330 [Nocardioidaceae bacterium]